MSGSFYTLNQKFNTLYALFLQLQNGSATDLSAVLTNGNTADNDIILTDGLLTTTLTKISLDITQSLSTITLDFLGLFQTKNYTVPHPYTLSSSLSDETLNFYDANNNNTYLKANQLYFTNGTATTMANTSYFSIDDSINSSKLTTTDLAFNNEVKGIFSIGNDLQINSGELLDLACNAFSLNSDMGSYGDVIISGGAGSPPQFADINSLICKGIIDTPDLTGTVIFLDYDGTFDYVPVVNLTVVSGNTTIYLVNIIAITNLQFTYQMSGLGAQKLNFIAI